MTNNVTNIKQIYVFQPGYFLCPVGSDPVDGGSGWQPEDSSTNIKKTFAKNTLFNKFTF